jgi:hypothetical protein
MPLLLSGTNGVLDNSGAFVAGTAVASTSGTSIDFTGIPSWAKRVTVMFNRVSTNGGANIRFQVGSGSVNTSGYSGAFVSDTAGQGSNGTNGTNLSGLDVYIFSISASYTYNGSIVFALIGANTWSANGMFSVSESTTIGSISATTPALSGALDRVRITTSNGTDAFDAGSINILYE